MTASRQARSRRRGAEAEASASQPCRRAQSAILTVLSDRAHLTTLASAHPDGPPILGGTDDGADHDLWRGLFARGTGEDFMLPAICSAVPQSLSRPPTAPSDAVGPVSAGSLPVLASARDRCGCLPPWPSRRSALLPTSQDRRGHRPTTFDQVRKGFARANRPKYSCRHRCLRASVPGPAASGTGWPASAGCAPTEIPCKSRIFQNAPETTPNRIGKTR